MPFQRQTLSDQVRKHLLRAIVSGDLAPESDIRESELAEELGVSRTPLREALLRLEVENFLERRPGKGFYVRPLSRDECEELYTAVGILEAAALREAGLPSASQLRRMRQATERRTDCMDDPVRQLELDQTWHAVLLDHVENRVLLDLLSGLKTRLVRYERAYMADRDHVETALRQHREMEALLAEGGALARVAERLQEHWQTGVEHFQTRLSHAAEDDA